MLPQKSLTEIGTGIRVVKRLSCRKAAVVLFRRGAGIDTLSSFANLTGSAFNDVLTGSSGSNVLTGLDGNNTLSGSGGADTLIGGLDDDVYVVKQRERGGDRA
jgi:Ca2+-binding RTX toxin-like protein